MRGLPPGWETDLAILEHTGSVVTDHRDHLVVRSPRNPGFHWGNCVFVTDADAVDDAERWVRTFQAALPGADWVAIGLIRMPDDQERWAAHGLEVGLNDVLSTRTVPSSAPLASGYTARRLTGDDWDQLEARAVAGNEGHEPTAHARFARKQAHTQRALSEQDIGAFFGAFHEESLVASLGIVRCGTTARYQSVGTDKQHRRRGLATHLLGIAARWSAEHGCDRWVIVTEASNPAGRVYRSVGFEPDIGNAEAYRPPGH